eukprot:3327690-Rhodomonas_salina.1
MQRESRSGVRYGPDRSRQWRPTSDGVRGSPGPDVGSRCEALRSKEIPRPVAIAAPELPGHVDQLDVVLLLLVQRPLDHLVPNLSLNLNLLPGRGRECAGHLGQGWPCRDASPARRGDKQRRETRPVALDGMPNDVVREAARDELEGPK